MDLDDEYESARRPEDAQEPKELDQGLDERASGVNKLYKNDQYELTEAQIIQRQQRQDREARFGKATLMSNLALDPNDQLPPLPLDSYASLRVQALYIFSKALGSLNTKAVLAYANRFVPPSTLLGLEWIDDTSGVLVFSSAEHALAGLNALLLDDAVVAVVQTAVQQLSDMYSEQPEDQLCVLAQAQLARPIVVADDEKPTWLRIARLTDKKAAGARQKSKYYAERGPPRDARRQTGRREHVNVADLDAELDAFAAGDDADTWPSGRLRSRRDGGDERPARDNRDRELDRVDRQRDRRDEVSALDRELESYARGEEVVLSNRSRRPRSRSPRPRRASTPEADTSLNAGVELFSATSSGPSLLQRLSTQAVLPDAHVVEAPSPPLSDGAPSLVPDVSEPDNLQAAQPEDLFARISPAAAGYQPSTLAKQKRLAAADLFDDKPQTERNKKGGMFGWDD